MILIFGANGQVGTDLKELLTRAGKEYIATDINEIDITKKGIVKKYILDTHKFKHVDTIINCAAYNNIDMAEEEKDKCFKVNMEANVELALTAAEIRASYITYSTDILFDGKIEDYLYNNNMGFVEEDEVKPLTNFAQSKYEAEALIANILENNPGAPKIYIIRTSWVFGKGRDNFIEQLIRSSKENDEIFVVDDQVSSPTYSKDLAEFSLKILNKNLDSGIYHFTNDGIVSKYDYAKYILKKIDWQGDLIPIKTSEITLTAKRPEFSKLNCKKIKEKLGEDIPHWTDAVNRYFKENLA